MPRGLGGAGKLAGVLVGGGGALETEMGKRGNLS